MTGNLVTTSEREEAERFIAALCGSKDAPVTFQTFDDSKEKRPDLSRILQGTLAERWDDLCRLNAAGAGIFLMVNQGDGKGRKKKNVGALRALFVDDDEGTLDVGKLALTPSIVVKTKRGPHVYWLLRPGEPLDRFTSAQKALIRTLHTDTSIHNLDRVMRVPGFLHLKADPFVVQMVDATDVAYSIEEVLAGIGVEAEPEPKAGPTPPVAPMDGNPEIIARATAKLATIPGGIQGSPQTGSSPTFKAAMALVRGFNLSDEIALDLLRRHYNPRCIPPWSEKELQHKVKSARETGRMAFGWLLKPHERHDTANGKRFAAEHGHDLRHCHPLKTWFAWDDKRFKPDASGEVVRRAKETARTIAVEAAAAGESDGQALLKWSAQSQMAPRLAAMIDLARSELPVHSYDLDRNPWLLNVQNGTLDLQTGDFREHRRSDLITKVTPYPYLPDAPCPLWTSYLAKFQPNEEVRAFLQRLFGYALTGDVAEEIFTIIQGDGQRGKSTLLNTIQAVMGEYAVTPQPGIVLSADRHADPERATPELMKLRGARLAVAYETAHGVTLDDAKVKRAASTDTIAARALNQNSIEFVPTHKLILATNHKPRVVATDWGTWRRVCLVPFEVQISEQEDDKHFKERLRAEYPAILSWMVEGCALWRKEGKLIIPAVLQKFRDEYRKAEDVLGQFVTDCLDLRTEASSTKAAVYAEYQQWSRENGILNQLTMISLGKRIEETWHDRVSWKHTKTGPVWVGLGVKPLGVKNQEAAKMEAQAGVAAPPDSPPKARKRTRRKA